MLKPPRYGWEWYWWWGDVDVRRQTGRVVTLSKYWDSVYEQLNGNEFDWRICIVASLGFLASSYSLFATSIIWPALAYIYPHSAEKDPNAGEVIDLVTLAGIIIGMLLFGCLADRFGRKSLYGLELIIIIFATVGIVFSSEGFMAPESTGESSSNFTIDSKDYKYRSSMNIFTAVVTWRFLLGVGIGAEYPMSGIIAAEYVSTNSRGTNIAIVFLMQSVGRLFAYLFSYAFLVCQGVNENSSRFDMDIAIDRTWRFVAGFGGVFAVVAIMLRLTIPESPRYHVKVPTILMEAVAPRAPTPVAGRENNALGNADLDGEAQYNFYQPPSTPWFLAAKRYLINKKKWKQLSVICLLWFLLDLGFYGMGLDSPSALNLLWLTEEPAPRSGHIDSYQVDPANFTQSIFTILENNIERTLEVSSISSLVGSLLAIPLINYFPRKSLLFWTSLALFGIFLITGIVFIKEFAKPGDRASLVFYSLAQFAFNLGPNTIIFIMAAEIWPSVFRGTFYGLAAASGKAGAMFIRPFVQMAIQDGTDKNNRKHTSLGAVIIIFGFIMLAIAAIARFDTTLPDVQGDRPTNTGQKFPPLPNKHLEEIAPEFKAGELAPDEMKTDNQISDQENPPIPLNGLDHENGQTITEPSTVLSTLFTEPKF